jgi:sortase A
MRKLFPTSRHRFRFVSFACFILGVGILAYILVPIISQELDGSVEYRTFLSPIPASSYPDFTKASNWFPTAHAEDFSATSLVSTYTLTIPKLRIDGATVAIGGEDLSEHLIQYPGTAVPGKTGNAVVFGHSVLPQFFNAKNYLTIFSTLPKLSKGDSIRLSYDGVQYSYIVSDKFEIAPTDIQILDQPSDGSYLTLVTCSPPGDPRKPRRLVIRATLVRDAHADASVGY